jgi:hypothetical protein
VLNYLLLDTYTSGKLLEGSPFAENVVLSNFSVGCGEGYLIPERPIDPGRKPVGPFATKQSGLLQSVSYRRV